MSLRAWLPCLGLLLALAVPLAGCKTRNDGGGAAGNGLNVLTTFPPIYCLTASVAGEDASVRVVMTERGPHDHEFSPADADKLRGATLFFINGLGLDDGVANKMVGAAANKPKVIDLGGGLPKELLAKSECDHEHGPGEAHDHGDHDPHVWLGVPQA